VEALRLGYGAITYLSQVFECSERAIERGLQELDELPSQHLFMQDLQELVNDLGIEIRVADYPS